ncbi:hypothetical protein D5S17_07615 [Pseudonocardiaceae bacterium YIM PH 21723]|nr:hypothetical protein D5S17_07615 [Pseudonocardiaceae bacterium YIM PH 21723]
MMWYLEGFCPADDRLVDEIPIPRLDAAKVKEVLHLSAPIEEIHGVYELHRGQAGLVAGLAGVELKQGLSYFLGLYAD